MFKNYLKISTVSILCAFGLFSSVVGCKNAADPLGHQGPFDVPTSTPTVSGGIAPTATLGPVNVSCYVNYGGNQTGISWNLLDPNGNTLNSTTQLSGGTPFLFTPGMNGIYSAQIPTQGRYFLSSQPLTIAGSGNYSVTFTCSGQTISANPSSYSYSSQIGYQVGPVTVFYSSLGNLNVPVSIQTSGLSSSFSVSPSYVILNNSGVSAPLTISKTGCSVNNNSLNFSAYDLLGGTTGATSGILIQRGYSIPVTFYYSVPSAGVDSNTGDATAEFIFSFNDGGLSCGSTYSFNTTFQPSDGPGAVPYSGSVNSANPTDTIGMSSNVGGGGYVNVTNISITLPDGSTRNCSNCINFTSSGGIGQTEILSTTVY